LTWLGLKTQDSPTLCKALYSGAAPAILPVAGETNVLTSDGKRTDIILHWLLSTRPVHGTGSKILIHIRAGHKSRLIPPGQATRLIPKPQTAGDIVLIASPVVPVPPLEGGDLLIERADAVTFSSYPVSAG
jgi:hypothetical protein